VRANYAQLRGFSAARLAALVHGEAVSRRIWESDVFCQAQQAVRIWRLQ
jgi:hypothetical protein